MGKIDKGKPCPRVARKLELVEAEIGPIVQNMVTDDLEMEEGRFTFQEWWSKFQEMRKEIRSEIHLACYKQNAARLMASLMDGKLVTVTGTAYDAEHTCYPNETHTGVVRLIEDHPHGMAIRFCYSDDVLWVLDMCNPLSVKRSDLP